jgi:hypothetical protein
VTIGFLVLSLVGHWVFGWFSYVKEQTMHAAPVEMSAFVMGMLRDTFENWQSEFLQLLWQVVGLTLLLHVGSLQSKDSEDRSEAKLDAILRVDPEVAEKTLAALSRKYPDH